MMREENGWRALPGFQVRPEKMCVARGRALQ